MSPSSSPPLPPAPFALRTPSLPFRFGRSTTTITTVTAIITTTTITITITLCLQSVVPKCQSPNSPPQALLSPASLSPTSLPPSPKHQNHRNLESPKRQQGSHPGLRNIENLVNGINGGKKEGPKFEQVAHLEPPGRTLNT